MGGAVTILGYHPPSSELAVAWLYYSSRSAASNLRSGVPATPQEFPGSKPTLIRDIKLQPGGAVTKGTCDTNISERDMITFRFLFRSGK